MPACMTGCLSSLHPLRRSGCSDRRPAPVQRQRHSRSGYQTRSQSRSAVSTISDGESGRSSAALASAASTAGVSLICCAAAFLVDLVLPWLAALLRGRLAAVLHYQRRFLHSPCLCRLRHAFLLPFSAIVIVRQTPCLIWSHLCPLKKMSRIMKKVVDKCH